MAVGNGSRVYKAAAMQTLAAGDSMTLAETASARKWQGPPRTEEGKDEMEKKGILDQIQVELGKIEVSKGLSETHVKEVVEKAMPFIEKCIKSEKGRGSIPTGEVIFNLVIGPKGDVLQVYMDKGQTEYDDFEQCVVNTLKTLQFLAKTERNEVNVRIVLILK
jgi:hypothetical protein